MQENENKEEKLDAGEIKINTPFGKRIENFWYYHKWHTIVAVFLVFAITVLSINMCDRRDFDITVIYAGSTQVSKTSENDLPTYAKIINSFSNVVGDVNGDSESNVAFSNLYYYSDEEISLLSKEERNEINETLLMEDSETLAYQMKNSTYYICIFTQTVFEEFLESQNGYFVKIAPYAEGCDNAEYVTEYGIRLSTVDFGKLEGINELPSDAVICLKMQNILIDRDGKIFKQSEDALKKILSYQK